MGRSHAAHEPAARAERGASRRVRRLLTPLGWGIAAFSVIVYAAGAAFGYEEAGVLAVGGVVVVLTALVWVLPQPSLTVDRTVQPLKVARGDEATGILTITSKRGKRGGLRAADVCGDTVIDVEVPRLRARAATGVTYRLPTDRRGEMPVGPLRLVRADPFGLARRVRHYGVVQHLLVRPRVVPLPLMPSGRNHHLEGPTTDSAPAGTVTFHALREYVMGDDLRHIHWKSSARTGTLMVRQHVDASLPQTTIVLDADSAAYVDPDDFELAADAAASVAVGAAVANFPVRIVTGAGVLLETHGGPHDVESVLDRLALVAAAPANGTAAIDVVRRVPGGGSLIVVTGAGGELTRAAAQRMRFDRVVCLRIRPQGAAPGVPGVNVIDLAALDELPLRWRGAAR